MNRFKVLALSAVMLLSVAGAALCADNLAGAWPTVNGDQLRTGYNSNIPYTFGAWTTGGAQLSWSKNEATDWSIPVRRTSNQNTITVDANDNIYFREAFYSSDPLVGGAFRVISVNKNGGLNWAQSLPAGVIKLGNDYNAASVVCGADAVYTVAKDYDGATDGQTGFLMAINKATGATIWNTVLQPNGTYTGTRPTGGNSTPILYNGKLYVLGTIPTDNATKDQKMTVYAVNAATGAILSQADLPYSPNSNVFQAPTFVPNIFGTSKHGIFFNVDGRTGATFPGVYAIEVDETGATPAFSMKWTADGSKTAYSRCIYSQSQNRLYVKFWGDYGYTFAAYDPITGTKYWQLNSNTSNGFGDDGWLLPDGKTVIARGGGGDYFKYTDDGATGSYASWYNGPDALGEVWGPSCAIGPAPGVGIANRRDVPGLVAVDGGSRCLRNLWGFAGPAAPGMRGGIAPLSDGRIVAMTDTGILFCVESTHAPELTCGTVTVNVTFAGEPVAGARVAVTTGTAPAKYAYANSPNYYIADSKGQVKLPAMIQGTVVTVGAFVWGCNPSKDYSATVEPSTDTPINVDLEVSGVLREVGGTVTSNYPISQWDLLDYVIDGLNINDPGHKAFKPAVDANDATKFPYGYIDTARTPNPSPPYWIMIDIGQDKGVVAAQLDMMHEPLRDLKIEALPDGFDPATATNWTTVYSVVGSNGGCPNTPGEAWPQHQLGMRFIDAQGNPITVTARYFRLTITKADFSTFALREFFLYGSDPSVVITPTNNRVGAVKGLNDGDAVSIINKVVTGAGTNVPDGCFYIEDVNRTAGIRVIAAEGMPIPAAGHGVSVVGTLTTTDNGEKAIQATSVKDAGAKGTLLPIGINNKAFASELTTGMLVKIWGTATSPNIEDGTFMLNDGSDTTGTGTKVFAGATTLPADGSFNAFEGIVGKEAGVPVIYLTKISLLSGDVVGDGWLKSWLLNGFYQVTNPGGVDPAWQVANLANDFLTADLGETAIRPFPGMVSNTKKWTPTTQPGGASFGVDAAFPGQANGQVSTYAFVYLYSPDEYDGWPKSAQLRLGSDDGIRAWVNGELVHANDTAGRGVTLDQDQVLIPLHQGWNTLLLKINNINGGYGFCARVMTDDGTGTYVSVPGLKFSLYPQQ